MTELDTYVKQPHTQVDDLKADQKRLEDGIHQANMYFEVQKKDIQKHVSRDLADYEGQGLGLEVDQSNAHFTKPKKEDIIRALNQLFNV